MKTVHLIISGSVQGVGYRKWIKQSARKNQIVGWTTNRTDGAVEAVLQGEASKVDALVERMWDGPFLANVTSVEVKSIISDPHMVDFVVIQ